jgi:hypothetical protein
MCRPRPDFCGRLLVWNIAIARLELPSVNQVQDLLVFG